MWGFVISPSVQWVPVAVNSIYVTKDFWPVRSESAAAAAKDAASRENHATVSKPLRSIDEAFAFFLAHSVQLSLSVCCSAKEKQKNSICHSTSLACWSRVVTDWSQRHFPPWPGIIQTGQSVDLNDVVRLLLHLDAPKAV